MTAFHFNNTESWYFSTYLISLLLMSFLFIKDCKENGYSIGKASMITLFSFTFFLIGAKLFALSGEELKSIFENGFQPGGSKTSLGGLALAIPAFLISSKILKAGKIHLDMLMIAIPVAMGIQRIGCFTAGCCFGDLYDGFFSVSYNACSPAGHYHIAEGLINGNASHSLSMFPTQLILAFAYFSIAFLVWVGRKRGWFKQGYFLLVFAFIFIANFGVDFLRSGFNNSSFSNEFYGLKFIQWTELFVAFVLLFIYLLKKERGISLVNNYNLISVKQVIWVLTPVGLFSALFWNWFNLLEQFSIIIGLVPVLVLALSRIQVPSFQIYKFATFSVLILIVLSNSHLISQNQWYKTDLTDKYLEKGRHTYSQIDIGYSSHIDEHYHDYGVEQIPNSCSYYNYYPIGSKYRRQIQQFQMNYSYTIRKTIDHKKYTLHNFQIGSQIGANSEKNISSKEKHSLTVGGIFAQYRFDGKWVGAGLGFQTGFYAPEPRLYDTFYLLGGHESRLNIRPTLYLRLLPMRYFFVYNQVGNEFFDNDINGREITNEIGVGTSFGKRNGTNLKIGFNIPTIGTVKLPGPSVQLQYFHHNSFGLNFKFCTSNSVRFQGGISYRFNHTHQNELLRKRKSD